MRKFIIITLCIGAAACLFSSPARSANLAADAAWDAAYSGGWTNGSNGGYGFGAWIFSPPASHANAGYYIGSSVSNGNGIDDGNVGGVAGDGDIDTGPLTPVSWGLYGNNGASATAIRPFTGGGLNPGQTFSIDFDNGDVEAPGEIILAFLDELFNPLFQISFSGGGTFYDYIDAGGAGTSSVGFGDEGLTFSMAMTGPTNYTAQLVRRDGASDTWSGTLLGAPGVFVAIHDKGAGTNSGVRFDLFINNMEIVPEPSVSMLAAFGALGIVLRCLRRR